MGKVAVIFDTNACRSQRETQAFFGERTIMSEIATRADILIPQIVIDELIQQNKEGTADNINNLKKNSLLSELGYDIVALDEIDINSHAIKIYENENIQHKVVKIKNPLEAFKKMTIWAIKGEPPFMARTKDGKNNSDKGFKDALVACTVEQILSDGGYDSYFLACHDSRLKDYFFNSKRIACLTGEEILHELNKIFFDDYTISRVREELKWPKIKLKREWININSDIVGLFEYEEYEAAVVFDKNSKEILSKTDYLFIENSSILLTSSSYSSAHEAAESVFNSLDFYEPSDLKNVLIGLTENNQVYGIGEDEDIKALAVRIYAYFLYEFTQKDKEFFLTYYNIREES